MRLSRPAGAKQHSEKARILCSPSTKQCLRTTPGAHFALFERKTAPRTHSPGAFRARRGAKQPTAPKRRRLSRPQTQNNFDRKSPRHARGDLHFSLCACRSRPAGGKARSRVQSPSKMKGNGKAVPFHFENLYKTVATCALVIAPLGRKLPSLKPVRIPIVLSVLTYSAAHAWIALLSVNLSAPWA